MNVCPKSRGDKTPPTPGATPKSPGRSTQDTKPGPGPSTPFHRFFAPQGARPDTESAWYKFKPEGDLSMGQIQTSACENAVLVCLEASDIQNIIASIEKAALLHINQPPTSNDPDDLHNRLGCAVELVLELMYFAAASYSYHKKQLDVAASLSPKKAWPIIKRQQSLMSKLVAILSATRCELSLLAPSIEGSTTVDRSHPPKTAGHPPKRMASFLRASFQLGIRRLRYLFRQVCPVERYLGTQTVWE